MIFRSIIILMMIIISGTNISAEVVKNYTLESDHIDWIKVEDKTAIEVYIPRNIDITTYESIMILRDDINLEVMIDGNTLIKVQSNSGKGLKATGKGWTIIPVVEEYIGKTITVVMENIYDKIDGTAKIYIGDGRDILWSVLKDGIIDIFVCTILAFIAATLFIVGRFEIGGNGKERGIFYVACFAVAIVLWRVSRINILKLFITADNMWSNIGYIGLSFTPITFIMNLATVFDETESKLIDSFCKVNLGVILLQQITHITGIAEFKETMWLTYILMLCVVGLVGYIYNNQVSKYRTARNNNIMKSVVTFIVFVTLGTILYKTIGTDLGIPALGAFAYICALTMERIRSTRIKSIKSTQIEVYKKLAFIDEMTGLYNRTALECDFNNYNDSIQDTENNVPSMAIIVVDMNNLKFCNDKYGHDKGDIFIKAVSGAILEAFSDDCKCYRMGGDEFCIICKDITLHNIEDKIKYMRTKVDNANRKNQIFKYNYALGYEWYDDNIDKTLQDTLRRADEKMYQIKRLMKNLQEKT